MFVNPLSIWYIIGCVGRGVAPSPPKPSSLITSQIINPLTVGEWNTSSSYQCQPGASLLTARPIQHDKWPISWSSSQTASLKHQSTRGYFFNRLQKHYIYYLFCSHKAVAWLLHLKYHVSTPSTSCFPNFAAKTSGVSLYFGEPWWIQKPVAEPHVVGSWRHGQSTRQLVIILYAIGDSHPLVLTEGLFWRGSFSPQRANEWHTWKKHISSFRSIRLSPLEFTWKGAQVCKAKGSQFCTKKNIISERFSSLCDFENNIYFPFCEVRNTE